MLQKLTKATVIGSGIMGHGISQLLGFHDIKVRLVDINEAILEKAQGMIVDNLTYMVELALLEPDEIKRIMGNIEFTTDLPASLTGSQYVLEAVSEDVAIKREVWSRLSEHAEPDAILASNTSSYDINELAEGVSHPERIVGTHWFHPAPITPCVEVIPGEQASRANIEWTLAVLTKLGKTPTLCKSAPGFVANRIQMAMAKEALNLVQEGLATPAEIDRIIKTSIGFRLSAFGPLEIADMAGIDTYKSIYDYLHEKVPGDRFSPPAILSELAQEGRLGLKSLNGFYKYSEDSAGSIRMKRDRLLYRRLAMFRTEQEIEKE